MNILTGYLSSTSGAAKVCGIDVLEEPLSAKSKIGYLPEQPPLYIDMTVREYLYFVYDLKKVKLPKSAHIKEVCGLVNINNVYNRLIKNLSKGYRQRVGLAGALIGNPEVIIMDEPTVGLDPKQIIEIRSLIRQLGKGHTVILSSHILSEIQAVCDRVLVINGGNLVADDTPENLSKIMSDDHRLTARICGPAPEILKILRKLPGVIKVESLGQKEPDSCDFLIEATEDQDIRKILFERLADRSWPLIGLKSAEMTLEDVFLKLTQDKNTEQSKPKKNKRIKIELEGDSEKDEEESSDEESVNDEATTDILDEFTEPSVEEEAVLDEEITEETAAEEETE